MQAWPLRMKIPIAAPATAASISASSKTMTGDLPPSSSVTFLRLPDAALTISLPTCVEPVNATFDTRGCAPSAAPATSPSPVTQLITPGGTPASCASSTSRSVDKGASSDGFRTHVQPAASAGAILMAARLSGKFQGVISAQTPTGCFSV